LEITKNLREDAVYRLTQEEIAIETSRQVGKTTVVAHTAEVIMTFVSEVYNRPIRIGIFAPQIDQARISYTILRNALRPIKGMMVTSEEDKKKIREEENAKKLVLPNGSSCVIAPISLTSKIAGLTLDLILIDEAQDADDEILKHVIWPMGKTTNAPRVYIGTAGTQICHFYRLGQAGAYKIYFDEAVTQRRQAFEQTKDPYHLIYEQSVRSDIEKYGQDSPEIQRQYFGVWQLGEGQFCTQEDLDRMVMDRHNTYQEKQSQAFAGIDTAKYPDSTVVTILRYNRDLRRKQVLNWMELQGDNYMNQVEIIKQFLSNYNVVALAIDATGQGDWVGDWFEQNTQWMDENSGLYRVKFSAVSKHNMYTNLKVSIKELLTDLPKLDTKDGERFKQQMLDLQQEYKGQLLHVAHPDDASAHDDYPDSWALAEWAYAEYTKGATADMTLLAVDQKERKVDRDSKGKVSDYWPGLDW